MDNVINLGVSKTYPVHRELITRIIDLIYEYSDEVNNVEVFGILEAVKLGIHLDTSLDFGEEEE